MDKMDLMEIRKALCRKYPTTDWVYGFYVTQDGQVAWTGFDRYAEIQEDAWPRICEVLKRSLAGTLGRELLQVSLLERPGMLSRILALDAYDDRLMPQFSQAVARAYASKTPYYAFLTRVTYDVPSRASDGARLEDGDNVYRGLVFSICPAGLSKPALGYTDTDGVAELSRRWTIGTPVEGFLYPAFSSRAQDPDAVLYRARKSVSAKLFSTLFGDAAPPVPADTQKDAFAGFMDDMHVSFEAASCVQEELAALVQENVQELDRDGTRALVERSGIGTDGFDEAYDKAVGDVPLTVSALVENAVTVTTDNAMLRVPADQVQLVRTEMLDGVLCLVLPVDGRVLVNGIPVSFT